MTIMATIPQAFAIATQHHHSGRFQAAEEICRRIVEIDPAHAEALHLLGLICGQAGNYRQAIEYIERAVAIEPNWAMAHTSLGNAFLCLEARDKAVACYRRALELRPEFPEAHCNLGNALKDLGQPDDAVRCYRRALQLKPGFAEAHCNLGDALREQGRLDEAVSHLQLALQSKPDFAIAHNNLGNALGEQGKFDAAVFHLRRALQLQPDFTVAHNNLGNVFKFQGQHEQALACYRRALELQPGYAQAHNNLGVLLSDQGRLDEATACLRRALELSPDYAAAYSNLGNALKDQRKVAEAVACYRRALELKPDYAEAHSNLLHTLLYCTDVTAAQLAQEHAGYERRHAAPLSRVAAPQAATHDSGARLRVGFVSSDLGAHPVGYFLVRMFENLGPDQLETVCYSGRTVKDRLTRRIHAAATQWRDVIGLDHERLAEQIRADRIDILFDLAGHLDRNRLLVFARKPAPVQITWAGCAGTSGLAAMDFILADRYVIPSQLEANYSEKVLWMPDGYVCYDPPEYAPALAPLPAVAAGYPTFGCFNNPAKINEQVVEAWARILHRVSPSRLVLKYKGMNARSAAEDLAGEFASRGIDPRRVTCLGYSPHAQLLAAYHGIDLALDPFPYSGCLTTCEALWMGVPVVTCPGETFVSRYSLSHLSNVGLTETIARDVDEYVELAVSLASDLPRLESMRAGLRERMAVSRLCDGQQFAANFVALLQAAWRSTTRQSIPGTDRGRSGGGS